MRRAYPNSLLPLWSITGMRSLRRLTPLVLLLVGCADEPAPPASQLSSVPSRERDTRDIVKSVGVHDDGTLTRASVYLHDRLGEERSVELVDGDHLVMTFDDTVVVLERAPQVHAWETMVHYDAEAARTDLQHVGIELRRSDGSIVTSTVVIPRSFAITSVPPIVRTGDVIDIGLAPWPDAETWGHSAIQCDGADQRATGTFYHAGDESPGRATIAMTELPDDAAYCDANLTIALHSSAGTYDPALANEDPSTLGIQQRTTRVRYYP